MSWLKPDLADGWTDTLFDNPRLFSRNLRNGVPEQFGMVKADGSDNGSKTCSHIGRQWNISTI